MFPFKNPHMKKTTDHISNPHNHREEQQGGGGRQTFPVKLGPDCTVPVQRQQHRNHQDKQIPLLLKFQDKQAVFDQYPEQLRNAQEKHR
jgi:hypothetical protein